MASGNDIKTAQNTYAGFTSMVKYGSVAVAIVAAIVVMLIA